MTLGELRRFSEGLQVQESLSWYACYTRGRHEKMVATQFGLRRIEVFLPVHKRDVQWSDRTKAVSYPLFPGYVFARFRQRDLPQVLNTRGLVTVLQAGGRLAAIPDEEIENVRRCASAMNDHGILAEREPLVEAGDRVRILSGPLAGVEGVVLQRRGCKRLLVTLSTVGEGLSIDLGGASLEVIGSGSPLA